jgi:hypothetical protein
MRGVIWPAIGGGYLLPVVAGVGGVGISLVFVPAASFRLTS